jgi:transketolase
MVALSAALDQFLLTTDKPTIVLVKGIIGYGAPHKQNTEHAHGEPLGDAEIVAAKKFYGWPEDAKFLVPPEVLTHFREHFAARGAHKREEWDGLLAKYRAEFPDEAKQVEAIFAGTLPDGWESALPTFPADAKGQASRESSGKVLNAVAKVIPWMVGGSADLAKSNKSKLNGIEDFQPASPAGRNINFGVREHAMGSICNGMALSGLRPFAAGFLIFSDYGRPAFRLASLSEIPVLYLFTHDSIGVGEDGPTHQPIEQLASLRAIPGVIVIRPADANEVTEAYRAALSETSHPVILALSRQNLPTVDRTKYASASGLLKGGYTLLDCEGVPEVILIGTGSEVPLCVEAAEKLSASGKKVRVVSLPSWELFERQTQEYRDSVLPPDVANRVTVEMGGTFGWERYAGQNGTIIGMKTFGASAPLKDLLVHFGFTVEKIVEAAEKGFEKAAAKKTSHEKQTGDKAG